MGVGVEWAWKWPEISGVSQMSQLLSSSNPSSNVCWSSPNDHFCWATSPFPLPTISLTFDALLPAPRVHSTSHNRFASVRNCPRLQHGKVHAPLRNPLGAFLLLAPWAQTIAPWWQSASKQAPTWNATLSAPSPMLPPVGFVEGIFEASEAHLQMFWCALAVAAILHPSIQSFSGRPQIASASQISPIAWISCVVPARCLSFSAFQVPPPSKEAGLAKLEALAPWPHNSAPLHSTSWKQLPGAFAHHRVRIPWLCAAQCQRVFWKVPLAISPAPPLLLSAAYESFVTRHPCTATWVGRWKVDHKGH